MDKNVTCNSECGMRKKFPISCDYVYCKHIQSNTSCKGCTRPKVGHDCVCRTCSRYWRDNYVGEQQ